MSAEMPELTNPESPTTALGVAVGAAHYWKRKADAISKHRVRVFGLGVILGIIIAKVGPTVAAWAGSAF